MPRKGDHDQAGGAAPDQHYASPKYMLWTLQALTVELRRVRSASALERVLSEMETALAKHEAAKTAFPEVYFGPIEAHLVKMNKSLDRIAAALERATGIVV